MKKKNDQHARSVPGGRPNISHLEKIDKYRPFEVREDGDWVVVFFPETMSVRLFKTLEEVGMYYNWCTYRSNVYVTHAQVEAKWGASQLHELCGMVGIECQGKTTHELAKMFWEWCQQSGDKVQRAALSRAGELEDEDTYTVRLDLLKNDQIQGLIKTMPKQAQVIAACLLEAEKTLYTETQLQRLAFEMVQSGKLNTKQDPFRVVRYYAPTLYDIGVMSYAARRHKGDGELVAA